MRKGIINGGDGMSNVVQSKIVSVRMTIIEEKHQKAQPVLVRMWRKGTPRALLVGLQNVTAIAENSMGFLKKLKI